jgi:GST-like protein
MSINYYYFPTPNCHKVMIFLQETGLSYRIHPINTLKGDQFRPDFLTVSPNNKIPAIVDERPPGGGGPISLFESGAILWYLAERTDRFLAKETHVRFETLKWLFWQVAGLGPVAGQNTHFRYYAPEKLEYAISRFTNETGRLYSVLNRQLEKCEFVAGEYSIADIACYPWIVQHAKHGQDLGRFPNVHRWMKDIATRPAVVAAYKLADEVEPNPVVTDESRRFLFGQNADTVRDATDAIHHKT